MVTTAELQNTNSKIQQLDSCAVLHSAISGDGNTQSAAVVAVGG